MSKRTVLAFAASNSQHSINRKLALHAGDLLCAIFEGAIDLATLDLNDFEMPIYSPERQAADGVPAAAQRFYDQITAADAVIVSFAEHNGSYSAAYKNIFDWCSRIDRAVYQGRPMLLLATSQGSRGGAVVLKTAQETLPALGGDVVASFKLGAFSTHFDEGRNAMKTPEFSASLRRSVHALGAAILLD